ncbi:MAG TPA: M56 family metallopeptidase, partial [Chitinophagaceae bacterium]|nr:M56 family metallopeptidase [Chitinophagaceae bacterium]
MQDILQYLLKLCLALAVVYIFYRLVLRPLTFYQWNRRYLVLYSIVAFFIPFIDINTYVTPQRLQGIQFVKYIPVIHFNSENAAAAATQSNSIDILLIAGLLIATGSILLLTKLLLQWHSLNRIRRTAVPLYHPEANVYHVDEHVIPFSFGNSIYVNTTLHSEQELQDIILHEFVHVRQRHSFDIILSEALCILNWYNPFAWCIRHAIRQNLEFIADQSVLNNGLDKRTY